MVSSWESVWQGCTLSLCLFNLNVEHILRKAGFDLEEGGIISRRWNSEEEGIINNLRCTDDTAFLAESREDLKRVPDVSLVIPDQNNSYHSIIHYQVWEWKLDNEESSWEESWFLWNEAQGESFTDSEDCQKDKQWPIQACVRNFYPAQRLQALWCDASVSEECTKI